MRRPMTRSAPTGTNAARAFIETAKHAASHSLSWERPLCLR